MKNFFTFLALFLTVAILTGDALRDSTWARSYGLTLLAPHDSEKDVLKELITSMWARVKKILSQFLP